MVPFQDGFEGLGQERPLLVLKKIVLQKVEKQNVKLQNVELQNVECYKRRKNKTLNYKCQKLQKVE
jgi:hypothetical protein